MPWKFDRWIFVPLLSLFLLYFVIFRQSWAPIHDTLAVAQLSHQVLSSIAHDSHWSFWSPFMDWGKNIQVNVLAMMSPALVVLSPLAKLFPHGNALTFNYLAYLLSDLILICGAWLLGRSWFRNSASTAFLSVSLLGTSLWFAEPHFNYGIFYALCVPLYFFYRCASEHRLDLFFLGLLALLIQAAFGQALYLGFIQTVYCLVFLATCLWMQRRQTINAPQKWKTALVTFTLLIGTLGLVALFLFASPIPSIISPGRPASGTVSYSAFINHLYDRNLYFFSGMLDGLKEPLEASGYGGILMVPMALVGVFFGDPKKSVPVLVAGLAALLFYVGPDSFVAPLLYFVPGFHYYRHIGLVVPLLKLTLLLLAGLGVDALLTKAAGTVRRNTATVDRKAKRVVTTSGLIVLLFGVSFLSTWAHKSYAASALVGVLYLCAIGTFVWLRIWRRRFARWFPVVLVAIAALDVTSFRFRTMNYRMLPLTESEWARFSLRKTSFIPQRTFDYRKVERYENFIGRHQRWGRLNETIGASQNFVEPLLEIDPCLSLYRNDTATLFSADFAGALSKEFAYLNWDEQKSFELRHRELARNSWFLDAIGCESSKLKVADGAAVSALPAWNTADRSPGFLLAENQAVESYREASKQLALPTRLTPPEGAFAPSNATARLRPVNGTIQEFEAGGWKADVRVENPHGAWFYYAGSWQPDWKAWVGGTQVPILRANHAFQAIWLPAGQSSVQMRYSTRADRLAISLLWAEFCALILALLVATGRAVASSQ